MHAAGHLKPGRRPARLLDVAETVDVVPSEYGEEARLRWLDEVIARRRPDVIQTHWLPTWGYVAVRCAERPVAVTAWGSDLYLATRERKERADWALHAAHHVLALSPHMRREILARGVAEERIHDVDLGVDLDRFRPAREDERAELRSRLALPAGPLILSMRAGTDLYNLDVVLEAFLRARRQVPDATLVLVHGDAPLSERVRALLDRLDVRDGVRVVGHVPHEEIADYVRTATVAVSIPDSDGSPSSVWECLAAGVPVVVSALSQIEERLADSGAGIAAAPRCAEVAGALIALIEDEALRTRTGRAGRDWALTHADQREQRRRLGAVYAAMARPSPAPTPAPARDRR